MTHYRSVFNSLVSSTDLTRGEWLLLARRRKRWTQADAAKHWSVPVSTYVAWETDQRAATIAPPSRDKSYEFPLKMYERLFVMRRRSGWTAPTLAARIGCPRHYIELAERGRAHPARLEAFWRMRGAFRGPKKARNQRSPRS